jgi:hypothetical protein
MDITYLQKLAALVSITDQDTLGECQLLTDYETNLLSSAVSSQQLEQREWFLPKQILETASYLPLDRILEAFFI